MSRTEDVAREIAVLMPIIARKFFLKFFESVKLTQTQIFTIMTLADKAPCRLNELAGIMDITPPTVTGIIDRLEKLKYVKRIPDTEDRRAVNVGLTAKGENIAKSLRTTIRDNWKDVLSKLPEEDQENYLR
ncbi:MAG: winged helix-turn-helix transcriptional regulator, partial [Candidatus Omnitrophica bacterium]|nr:winged helix-turn-helix transcriptional regulator [Candidatus Omnitrophota bacterium]